MRSRPRRLLGPRSARRRRRHHGDEQARAGARLLRDERRPRLTCVRRVRLEPPDPGDRRLLGRPGRRLRDLTRPEPAGLRRTDREDTTVDLSLAFWLPKATSVERVADYRYRVRTSARNGSRQYLSYRPSRRDVLRPGAHVEPGRDALPARRCQGGGRSSSSAGRRAARAGFPTTMARWHVLRDDRAGTDEGLFPDLDPGQRIAPPPMRAPRRMVGPAIRSRRRSVRPMKLSFVVDAGGDEDVVLECGVGRDVGLGLDLRERADRRVVLHERAAAEDDVVADRHARSRTHDWSPRITRAPMRDPAKTIAPVETIVPSPISVGDSGSRCGRAGRQRRLLAHDGVLQDLHALPSTVPGRPSRSGGRQLPFSDVVSMSSARTTRAVLRDLPAVALARDERRNSRHSSLSGSSVAIFGMWMSPVRMLPFRRTCRRASRATSRRRHLAVELHVVEHGHLLGADHGHLRILCGSSQEGACARCGPTGSGGSRTRRPRRPAAGSRGPGRSPRRDRRGEEEDREVVDAERPGAFSYGGCGRGSGGLP